MATPPPTRVFLQSHLDSSVQQVHLLDSDLRRRPAVDDFRRQFFVEFAPAGRMPENAEEFKLYLLPQWAVLRSLEAVRDHDILTFSLAPPAHEVDLAGMHRY